MAGLSIGDAARQTGIKPSAIRYYESAGILPVPERIGGQRRYDSSILDRLALVQFAQQAGFTIGEIRTLFEGFEDETPASDRWQVLAQHKLEEIDAMIARAERMKVMLARALDCRCLQLKDCARIINGSERQFEQ